MQNLSYIKNYISPTKDVLVSFNLFHKVAV